EIDCTNDDAYDRAYGAPDSVSAVSMTANSTYTYRYRAHDAAGNETAWSGNYSTCTLSVPPDWSRITCSKSSSTWYGSDDFVFTAAGGFGTGTVAYYEYSWDTNTVASGYPNTWASGTANISATFNSDNWYFHVKGYNWSGTENGTFDFGPYQCSGIPVNSVTDLAAAADDTVDGKISLEWTSVGGAEYAVKYNTSSLADLGNDTTAWWNASILYSQTWEPAYPGQVESSYGLSGLIPATSYYVCVRALSIYGSSTSIVNVAGPVMAGDKVPAAPGGLKLTLAGTSVKVDWDANTEPDINRYWIYRDNIMVSTVSQSTTKYIDSSVVSGNTYSYKLKAIDDTGNISPYSAEKKIMAGDVTEYDDVDFIEIDSIKDDEIVIGWPRVPGSIKGYSIERTDDLAGGWKEVGFVNSSEKLRYSVPLGGKKIYYYRVVTVSSGGTRSAGLLAIDTSEDVNHIFMSEDNGAWVMVPFNCARELYPENNNGKLISLVLEKENSADGFLMQYDINAVKGNSVISDFIFTDTRKGVSIVMSYRSLTARRVPATAESENKQMVLYWHNGVEWVRLGGTNEQKMSRVYTSCRRLGKFGIKLAALADEFTLNTVEPRLFIPEEQNFMVNAVRFYFENPDYEEVTIKIFDITGAEIRSSLRREGENVMFWDGKDEGGKIVKGGIYIYQAEAGDKIVNGSIVVAR
ncbi:MAG: hypothetical protein JXJ19_09235, partial [Elusimicrobia bacterium]|nr:hypothetical protein [Elusimicrobiota bacterium]